ncbi:hypothetical protein ACIF0M_06225, partial [Dorea amylophila]
ISAITNVFAFIVKRFRVFRAPLHVSNHVWRYSLELSSREWAQQIEEILKTYERKDGRDQVIEAGYDVKNTAENLQRFYLEHSKK